MADDFVVLIAPEDNNTFKISSVPGRGTPGEGAEWHFVTGAPGAGVGNPGDFALRDNWAVYEKTDETTWTLRGNIKGADGTDGDDGTDGTDGVGITGIALHNTVGNTKTYRITLSDATTFDFDVVDGADGTDGTDGDDGADGADGATWHWVTGAPGSGLGAVGDFALRDTWEVYEKTDATTWTSRGNIKGATGAVSARDTETYTTASLANNAEEAGEITLAIGYRLMKIQTDKACRVRMYATAAQQAADAARPIGTDPTGDHGLLFEYVATGAETVTLNPFVDGASMEVVPVADIPISVQNRSGGSGTVAVTLTFQVTE